MLRSVRFYELIAIWLFISCYSIVCKSQSADGSAERIINDYQLALQHTTDTNDRVDTMIHYANLLCCNGNTINNAIVLATSALQLSEQTGYEKGVIHAHIVLGNNYNFLSQSDKSLEHFFAALSVAEHNNSTKLQEIIYANIANLYQAKDQYEHALEYYFKAMDVIKRSFTIQDAPEIAYAVAVNYSNMSSALERLYNYEQALHYATQSEFIAVNAGLKEIVPYSKCTRASILLRLDRIAEARSVCQEILSTAKAKDAQLSANLVLGELSLKQKDTVSALMYYQKANAMSYAALDKMLALNSLSAIYFGLGLSDSSEKYTGEALILAKQYNARLPLMELYSRMAALNERKKNYQEATYYYSLYKPLKDSLSNVEQNRLIYTLETKYRAAEKDRNIANSKLVIAQQQSAMARQRLWTGIVIALCVMLILVFSFYHFYSNKIHKQEMLFLKQQEKTKSLLAMTLGEEKERKRIASDLHDGIGGLLAMVKMYFANIQKKQPLLIDNAEFEEAVQLLDQSLNEVRKTAHNLMPELLLQHGLPEAVRIYCNNIQSLKQLRIDFQYYGFIGRLNSSFELFIYRIIQELMQNILKHAAATSVLFQMSLHDNMLNITIEDDGIGFTDNAYRNGTGLTSIKNRIKDLNGEMNITSTQGQGTSIVIEFDLQTQEILINEN